MKIGLVRRGFSASGGAEAYLARFAAALSDAGHSSILFAGPDWTGRDWKFGETRLIGGSSPWSFADALEAARPREACDFLFSLERVWRCDCYRAGDGVHSAWLARRERHEPWWESAFRRLRPKHRELLTLERRLFRPDAAQQIIANSKLVRDEIVRHFQYPAERIRVIYNGVPLPAHAPDFPFRQKTRQHLGLTDQDYVALFVGSGWERKGLNFAMAGVNRAATKANLKFLVAGRGDRTKLPVSSRTRFLGPVANVRELLAAADVFLLPTLYDPFSNACLEAFAAGLPVITTASNGFAEIITPGRDGEILDDATDIEGMARALEGWEDSAKRSEAQPRLAAAARQFSVEENLRATLAVIEKGSAG